MRYFHGQTFLGGGETSKQEVGALQHRLAKGIGELGALQQPDHPESEEHAERCRADRLRCEQEIEDVVRDIAAALLGREVHFGQELPYPPPTDNARLIDGKLTRKSDA